MAEFIARLQNYVYGTRPADDEEDDNQITVTRRTLMNDADHWLDAVGPRASREEVDALALIQNEVDGCTWRAAYREVDSDALIRAPRIAQRGAFDEIYKLYRMREPPRYTVGIWSNPLDTTEQLAKQMRAWTAVTELDQNKWVAPLLTTHVCENTGRYAFVMPPYVTLYSHILNYEAELRKSMTNERLIQGAVLSRIFKLTERLWAALEWLHETCMYSHRSIDAFTVFVDERELLPRLAIFDSAKKSRNIELNEERDENAFVNIADNFKRHPYISRLIRATPGYRLYEARRKERIAAKLAKTQREFADRFAGPMLAPAAAKIKFFK